MRPFSVAEAAVFLAIAFYGLLVAGLFGYRGPLVVGLTEVLWFALPAGLVAWRRGFGSTIGFVAPRPRALAGAVLVGASGWAFLATVVLQVQEQLAPTPPALEEALRRAVTPDLLGIVNVVLLPALCEEILLRGVVSFALANRFGRVAGVVGSAVLFALLHFSLYRLAPTFLLGCSFGAMAIATGSIIPSIVAHALNNGALWLLSAYPGLQSLLEAHTGAVAVGATVTLAAGHILVFLRNSDVR